LLNFKAKKSYEITSIFAAIRTDICSTGNAKRYKISSNPQSLASNPKKFTSLTLQGEHLITQLFSKAAQINYTAGHGPYTE
jgi:hypothetical protein